MAWPVARCAGDYGPYGQRAIELREAATLDLVEVVWEVPDAYDLDALTRRLSGRGIEPVGRDGGVAFADVAGIPLACMRGVDRTEAEPPPQALRPRRLGHVNLKVPDPPAAAAFLR